MLLSTSPVSSTFGVRAFTLLAWQGRYKVLPSHFHPGLFKCKAELFEGKAWLVGGGWWGTKEKVLCRKRQAPRRAMPSQDP